MDGVVALDAGRRRQVVVGVSEVDVAFRRAQAALKRLEKRLSAHEWERDLEHRRNCRVGGVGCDDVAHHYQQALADGRVFVDDQKVIMEGGRWVIQG